MCLFDFICELHRLRLFVCFSIVCLCDCLPAVVRLSVLFDCWFCCRAVCARLLDCCVVVHACMSLALFVACRFA